MLLRCVPNLGLASSGRDSDRVSYKTCRRAWRNARSVARWNARRVVGNPASGAWPPKRLGFELARVSFPRRRRIGLPRCHRLRARRRWCEGRSPHHRSADPDAQPSRRKGPPHSSQTRFRRQPVVRRRARRAAAHARMGFSRRRASPVQRGLSGSPAEQIGSKSSGRYSKCMVS